MSISFMPDSNPTSNSKASPAKKVQQKISCVLLVCVYDTIVFEITNDLICSRFQEFGTIVRLLIFEKKEVTKFFVQFETVQQAYKAKQAMDGKKLCNNICKMSIYYSNFDNVDLKHQTTQGIEFMPPTQQLSISSATQKSQNKPLDDFDQFQCFGSFGMTKMPDNGFHFSRSKTDINEIQWHLDKMKKEEESNWSGLVYIDQSIKSDIDSILNQQAGQSQNWSANSQTNQTHKKSPALKTKTLQSKDESPSVLGFKLKNPVKHQHLYNLFSNFGNVSMIKLTKTDALVRFRSPQFAAIANNYLNGLWLFGNKMDLTYFANKTIMPEEGQYCQLISYDQSSDRFTPKKSITINPPSKVLHISGLKKQKCTANEITCMFKHIVEPTRVKILKQNLDKNMALAQFGCLEDSFDVVADCHNMVVGGRKVQISFTKSQI